MSKADANIKVGADTTAFSKSVEGMAKGITEKLEKIGNVFMGALGLKAAAQNIAGALSAFTEPAAKLEDAATVLEVMIGNAEGAERLARSLQGLATNGVVGFEDLFRAARSLTNVFQDDAAIAHYVGMLAAFEKLTEAGARYHEQNARQSNTTKGSWDTLRESVSACMGELGKPVNEALRPVLQEMAVWVQRNRGEIEKLGASIAPVMRELSGALTVAAPGLVSLGKAAAGVTVAIAELAAFLSKGAAVAVYLGGSYHGVAVALALLCAKMQGPFMAAGLKMQGIMRLMRLKMVRYRAEVMATGSSFKVIMAGMAVSAKAALTSIKAAFARNAITLAILALGEAVGWLYTKFSAAEDAAKDMGSAAEDAAAATEEALEASRREMEQREEATRAEAERTRQMEEQVRLAQEAADAEKERLKTVAEMARARQDGDFEREMDALREVGESLGGGEAGVVRERLRRVGAPSEEALYAERDRLERSSSMSEEEQLRYEAVAAAIGKIEEEHRRAEEAARAHRQEMERLRDNYYDRKSTYNRNRADEAYEQKSLPAQEKQLRRDAAAAGYFGELDPEGIREHLDGLARTDVKGNERQIAALERILGLYDELVERKKRFEQQRQGDMQGLRIQALELAGRHRAAAALRDELEMQKRVAELRAQGATRKQAEEQAGLELKVKKAQEYQQGVQASRLEFVQGHLANVGGGGVSYRIGSSQLQEAKRQSKFLSDIFHAVKDLGKAGNGYAVLA